MNSSPQAVITPIDRVKLPHHRGARRACLRELCGVDEQLVTDDTTGSAIRLLDRLLVQEIAADLAPGRAEELTPTERDLLLAALYHRMFGRRVATTVKCSACQSPFDVDFLTDDLLERLQASELPVVTPSEGIYALPNGGRFRPLTGADELAIAGMPAATAAAALLACCMVEGDVEADGELIQQMLERLVPTADADLTVQCPECGHNQRAHFNLQSYLLTALSQERGRLAREVHRIAVAYGWGLSEILALPRSQRRAFVQLAESEPAAATGVIA